MVSAAPISFWTKEPEGRSWFAIRRDSLRAAFECDERLRGALARMGGELIEFRLAAHARPRASATSFVAKVIQSRGKPVLKLPRVDEVPLRPDGPVFVRLSDGREWEFRFVKVACNVDKNVAKRGNHDRSSCMSPSHHRTREESVSPRQQRR
jgi:hypothetical protein